MPFPLITTPPPTGTADAFTNAPGGGESEVGFEDGSGAAVVGSGSDGGLVASVGAALPPAACVLEALLGLPESGAAGELVAGSAAPVLVGPAADGAIVGVPVDPTSTGLPSPGSEPPQAATNGAAQAAQSTARLVG